MAMKETYLNMKVKESKIYVGFLFSNRELHEGDYLFIYCIWDYIYEEAYVFVVKNSRVTGKYGNFIWLKRKRAIGN